MTLVINAAEGHLQFVLGRQAPAPVPASVPVSVPAPEQNSGLVSEFPVPEVLVAEDWSAASQGVELLAPALDVALKQLKLAPAAIGKIAAVTGPGSFTGIRLATVTATALASALDAESAGLEYLPLLAAGVEEVFPEAVIWALTYARRELVYAQGFMRGKNISPLLVLNLDECLEFLNSHASHYTPDAPHSHNRALLFGSALSKNLACHTHKLDKKFHLLPPAFNHPSSELLLKTALRQDYAKTALAPIYARPSDAEENLPRLAASLGLNQTYAQTRLQTLLGKTPDS